METKTVSYKHANVSDGWLREMGDEGFGLAPLPKSKQKPSEFTDEDKDQVVNMMRLKPDESMNDSNSGMSKRMNATHSTSGNSSVRSITSLQTLLETTRT